MSDILPKDVVAKLLRTRKPLLDDDIWTHLYVKTAVILITYGNYTFDMLTQTTKDDLRDGFNTMMGPSDSARMIPPCNTKSNKRTPFDVSPKSSSSLETFVYMHDVLEEKYNMMKFGDVAWDPVLRELSQSGRMTKRIVEYFEASRSRKKNLSTEITDESTPNPPYPVHSMRKSGATIIPAPTVRYKVKKESSLVRSMEKREKPTSDSALSVDKKQVITHTAWL